MKEIHENIGRRLKDPELNLPDFSGEDWLKLDHRLTDWEYRRRRRAFLAWSLPLALLLGFNAWLGWRFLTHIQQDHARGASMTIVTRDTVYITRTIYQTDTLYLPGRVIVHSLPENSTFATRVGVLKPETGGPDSDTPLSASGLPSGNNISRSMPTFTDQDGQAATERIENAPDLDLMENKPLALLPWTQLPWYELYRELPFLEASQRRVRLASRSFLQLATGPIHAWYSGESCKDGFGLSLSHELRFVEHWAWWQSFSLDRIEMDSKKKFIPDYPVLPFPAPNTKLEWTNVKRNELGLHTGIAYATAPLEHIQLRALLGLGTHYRLGGTYHVEFEDEDTEVYYPVVVDVASGWAGMNSTLGLGIHWAPLRRWQLGVEVDYHRHLGGGVKDYPIDSWLKLQGSVIWRMR